MSINTKGIFVSILAILMTSIPTINGNAKAMDSPYRKYGVWAFKVPCPPKDTVINVSRFYKYVLCGDKLCRIIWRDGKYYYEYNGRYYVVNYYF